MNKYDLIIPNLYLGGVEDGEKLPKKFKHIVSLCAWEQYKIVDRHRTRLEVMMYDNNEVNDELIKRITLWVYCCIQDGATLVHCKEGKNRSALIVASVLISLGYTVNEAIDLIRQNRSQDCLNNKAFIKYLYE